MKRKLWIIIVAIVLAMIWIQSLLPAQISAQESGWFTEHIVRPIAEWLGIEKISTHIVRKLAHAFEYLVLGLLTMALWKGSTIRSLQMCFAAAFLDETFQLLSNRGSQVIDVWIDLGGTVVGVGLFLLVRILFVRKSNENSV